MRHLVEPSGDYLEKSLNTKRNKKTKAIAKYFVEIGSIQKGPFTKGKIFKLWAQGEINFHTLIWKKGNENWVELKDFQDFSKDLPPRFLPDNSLKPLYPRKSLPPIPNVEDFDDLWTEDEGEEIDLSSESITLIEKKQSKTKYSFFKKIFYSAAFGLTAIGLMYVWISSQLQVPEGMSKGHFALLSEVIKTNPYKKVAFKSIYDPEKATLWLASNIDSQSMKVQLSALSEKTLSLTAIKAESNANLIGHFAKLDRFTFTEGTQFYPGFYQLMVEYRFEKTEQVFRDIVYIGESGLSETEFSSSLATYNSTVESIIKNYKTELTLNYDTLATVLGTLEEDFMKSTLRIDQGRKILAFQKSYIEKAGPFLTQFTLKNLARPEKFKIDLSKIASEFRDVYKISKSIAGLSSEIIEEFRSLGKITKSKRRFLRAKYLKKFSNLQTQVQRKQEFINELKPFF